MKKSRPFAALAIIILALILASCQLLTGTIGAPEATGTNQHGPGLDENTEYMSYAGPVLPLTLMEDAQISASRELTYDFAPTVEEWGERIWAASITDAYELENASGADKTVTLVYPFAGSFNEPNIPALTLNGEALPAQLHFGAYTGGFKGAGDENSSSLNLANISSFEGYKALLSDGSYMAGAFTASPKLDMPVTVYQFTDISDGGSDAVNPTLCVSFDIDYSKSQVLTYNFNGGSDDDEKGFAKRHFSIPKQFSPLYGMPCYLAILGEDIGEYALQGYQNGGCNAGEEISGVTAKVNRYESTLGELLYETTKAYYSSTHESFDASDANNYVDGEISLDMYFSEVCRFYFDNAMGENVKERYDFGRLDDVIYEVNIHGRVFYLTSDVTLKAGEPTHITAQLKKLPSFNHICKKNNAGILDYDTAVSLGSNLRFTGLNARLINYDAIEIVAQNMGFDIKNSVTEVTLDTKIEKYFIQIRKPA